MKKLISFISNPNADIEAVYYSIRILGRTKNPLLVDALIVRLDDARGRVSFGAINALGSIGDPRAVDPLIKKLDDENDDVRRAALGALAEIREDKTDQKLLSRDVDAIDPWLDPQEPIEEGMIKKAAKKLEMNEYDVRQRYERLAEKYKLKLSWKVQ
ncbi:MAG: HEAT repeat domain-containing protein [Candidatus Aminicenantes bacterium]|nr:MAG: HEAT repeat domain-containing protein [Candidatus Aminicenantes bacterium]